MPYATADDEIRLYYEETGAGTPLIFVHEFAGDTRSWEPQVRHFARRYRCITFNARGYPPSDVPQSPSPYSQARAADDVRAVLDHLQLARAHVAGLSMGGFATLHFGFRYPDRALSLCVAGCGYGAEPSEQEAFRAEASASAELLTREGITAFAERYAHGPTRIQFQNKDPRGFAEFKRNLMEHDALGSANTQLGVQRGRPSLYDLTGEMERLTVPTLLMTGDEDWPCLAPVLLMKRHIGAAGLVVLPNSGHTINLEEPDAFNQALGTFLALVDGGRWPMRDRRALSLSITGLSAP